MPYIILDAGLEYNDEIYSVGGGSEDPPRVDKKGYTNLDDAKSALREKYIKAFPPTNPSAKWQSSLACGNFSYDGDEPGWQLAERLFPERNYDDDRWNGPLYGDLIIEAEKQGVDWLKYMPQIYQIIEVNFE